MIWNPLDWTAGPFLALYLSVAGIVCLLTFRFRSMIGPAAQVTHQLSVLELACLADGAPRLGDAVLLQLTSASCASIDSTNKITVFNQAPLASLMSRPPLLALQHGMTRQQFQAAVKPITERVQARLRGFGYSPTEDQMMSFRMTTLPFIALVLMFGIMKAWIGAERQHPVGILISLLVLTAVAGLQLARAPMRTRAGNDALQSYRSSHARASRSARSRASSRRRPIRHRYPVRDLPRIGLCGLADDERRRRRRQLRRRRWGWRRMRWVQRMIRGSISKQWKYSAPLIYLPTTVAMAAE